MSKLQDIVFLVLFYICCCDISILLLTLMIWTKTDSCVSKQSLASSVVFVGFLLTSNLQSLQ